MPKSHVHWSPQPFPPFQNFMNFVSPQRRTSRFLACSCFIHLANQRNPGQLVSISSQHVCVRRFFFKISSKNNVSKGEGQARRIPRGSSGRNQKGVSHPSSAEVPKCYVLHAHIPKVPVSEDLGAYNLTSDSSGPTGAEKDDNVDEDRVSIRASSIPPPRAVISSPDNDTMIGNKNRIKGRERLPGSKNYGVLQNRHARCKVKTSNVTEDSPNMRKPKESADKSSNSTDSVQRRRPTKSASNQKTYPKKWEF